MDGDQTEKGNCQIKSAITVTVFTMLFDFFIAQSQMEACCLWEVWES